MGDAPKSLMYQYFLAALRSALKKRGKQKSVAIDIGLQTATISNLKSGRTTTGWDTMEAIARSCGAKDLFAFILEGRRLFEGIEATGVDTPQPRSLEQTPMIQESAVPPAPNQTVQDISAYHPYTGPERRKIPTSPRQGIIDLFENQDRIRAINLDLLAIEKEDPGALERVWGYAQKTLEDLQKKKAATPN